MSIAQNTIDRLLKQTSTAKDGKAEIGLIGLAVVAFNSDFNCIFCGKHNFDVMDFQTSVEHTTNQNEHRRNLEFIRIACTSCNVKAQDNAKEYNLNSFVIPTNEQLAETLRKMCARNIESFDTKTNGKSKCQPPTKDEKTFLNSILDFVRNDKDIKIQMFKDKKAILLQEIEKLNSEIENLA